ncbi:MAG: glutamate-1-semialdehyde 2,1-aminomutase, partial [Chitinophagaceae bacterium]
SQLLFERAQQSIPGGVNSPVRAFKSVGGTPIFMNSAKGAYLFDVDGNRYIDYINSWGPMILGHAYEPVIKAIQEKATHSTSFGTPTELEIKMAEIIVEMVPHIDQVRMVNSGTEACMTALRLARGYTGRNKIIKFEGCYHGHADSFLVQAGSGVATLGIQNVPGVTSGVAMDTLTAPFNDLDSVENLVRDNPGQIAAIILEPVAGNMGCVPPQPGYLEGIRRICDEAESLLIFDEVMTGFRLSPGGAQEYFQIKADLVTFGKIIGAGLPVGAFAGNRQIMSHIAPLGKVYQAGTLSGNPIAMVAGFTLLETLKKSPVIYQELERKSDYLARGLREIFRKAKIPCQINQVGSMLSLFFQSHPVTNFKEANDSDKERFNRFFHQMLSRGIYLPPSAFESWFLSNSLTMGDLDFTLAAAESSVKLI